jgi:hypothetical protein
LCIDYRGLNAIKVKDRAPIPDTQLLREQLREANVYSKFDLRDGYYNIRMKEGHEYKTAFKCRYGLYEWTVVPFGLSNAPAVFCALMNRIFGLLLDICLIAYIDDIIVYSKTREDHHTHLTRFCDRLKQHDMFLKLIKCSGRSRILRPRRRKRRIQNGSG